MRNLLFWAILRGNCKIYFLHFLDLEHPTQLSKKRSEERHSLTHSNWNIADISAIFSQIPFHRLLGNIPEVLGSAHLRQKTVKIVWLKVVMDFMFRAWLLNSSHLNEVAAHDPTEMSLWARPEEGQVFPHRWKLYVGFSSYAGGTQIRKLFFNSLLLIFKLFALFVFTSQGMWNNLQIWVFWKLRLRINVLRHRCSGHWIFRKVMQLFGKKGTIQPMKMKI